jgi:pyrroline-5-carboxylate reductase
MQQRRLAFIGAGNMSKAIIGGLIAGGFPADAIYASNPSAQKLFHLREQFGIHISHDNREVAEQAEVIVLAVKPQMMASMAAALCLDQTLHNKLFISIAAGISTARLSIMLGGHTNIVRTMPNTPSAIGKGMTGLFAEGHVSAADREFAGQMMATVGEIVWLQQESQIDGVIAAAGSSPAYFFAFLEAMQQEAEAQGFDHHTARLLVQQAMLGAAEMVCHNPQLEISQLRAQVTSKGGTTAEALACFADHQLSTIVAKAMQAAVKRAKEMAETM